MGLIRNGVLLLALSLTACTGGNQYGECVGLDEADQQPNLEYKISVRNAIWSFIAIETIVAPVLWVTDFAKCPTGFKK